MRGAETKVGLEILYADTHPVALIADTNGKPEYVVVLK